MNEPRLRHRIGDRRTGWAEPCYRSYVDDAASSLGPHDRGYRLGQAHRPRQIDGHDLVPHLQRQIVEIAKGDRDVVSSVIDQDIKAAEDLGYLAYQPIHSRAVGYVTGESLSVDLITRRQFAGDAFRLIAAASVHDSEVCALLRERMADALPQPAIAARHQCNHALQVHRFSPVMRKRGAVEAGRLPSFIREYALDYIAAFEESYIRRLPTELR